MIGGQMLFTTEYSYGEYWHTSITSQKFWKCATFIIINCSKRPFVNSIY